EAQRNSPWHVDRNDSAAGVDRRICRDNRLAILRCDFDVSSVRVRRRSVSGRFDSAVGSRASLLRRRPDVTSDRACSRLRWTSARLRAWRSTGRISTASVAESSIGSVYKAADGAAANSPGGLLNRCSRRSKPAGFDTTAARITTGIRPRECSSSVFWQEIDSRRNGQGVLWLITEITPKTQVATKVQIPIGLGSQSSK
ncbi:MAG: hypothetical protein ACI8P0_002077, partial [Planctomycetaceae bacterium]